MLGVSLIYFLRIIWHLILEDSIQKLFLQGFFFLFFFGGGAGRRGAGRGGEGLKRVLYIKWK